MLDIQWKNSFPRDENRKSVIIDAPHWLSNCHTSSAMWIRHNGILYTVVVSHASLRWLSLVSSAILEFDAYFAKGVALRSFACRLSSRFVHLGHPSASPVSRFPPSRSNAPRNGMLCVKGGMVARHQPCSSSVLLLWQRDTIFTPYCPTEAILARASTALGFFSQTIPPRLVSRLVCGVASSRLALRRLVFFRPVSSRFASPRLASSRFVSSHLRSSRPVETSY